MRRQRRATTSPEFTGRRATAHATDRARDRPRTARRLLRRHWRCQTHRSRDWRRSGAGRRHPPHLEQWQPLASGGAIDDDGRGEIHRHQRRDDARIAADAHQPVVRAADPDTGAVADAGQAQQQQDPDMRRTPTPLAGASNRPPPACLPSFLPSLHDRHTALTRPVDRSSLPPGCHSRTHNRIDRA
jgi:hypothetical protein